MKCSQVTSQLSALVERRVAGEQRAELQRHLDGCARCAALVERLSRAERALSALGPSAPPPDLAARAARVAIQSETAPRPRVIDSLIELAWPAAVVTAIAALLLYFGVGLGNQPAQAPVDDDPVGAVASFSYDVSDSTAGLLGEE